MKIHWISGTSEVPGLGVFKGGETREVPDDWGKRLVAQGLAEVVKAEPARPAQARHKED